MGTVEDIVAFHSQLEKGGGARVLEPSGGRFL